MNNATRMETIREMISRDNVGAGLTSITFTKKDGTERTLITNRAAEPSRIKGTARGQKWSATMDERHPHLVRVAEIRRPADIFADCRRLRAEGKSPDEIKAAVPTVQWRTIDLRTVTRVKGPGFELSFS